VPNIADFSVGEWNTFTITSDTVSSRTQAKAVNGACPDITGTGLTGPGVDQSPGATLEDGAGTGALTDKFLLGAADVPNLQPLIFAFNMGDTKIVDAGLVGYFDNIRVQIKDQPLIIMDL